MVAPVPISLLWWHEGLVPATAKQAFVRKNEKATLCFPHERLEKLGNGCKLFFTPWGMFAKENEP